MIAGCPLTVKPTGAPGTAGRGLLA
jgi:hypothetical protein